jgi:hypothetical protein
MSTMNNERRCKMTERKSVAWFGAIAMAAASWLFAPSAMAERIALPNLQNPETPSSFTLDFGELGGVASANITSSFIRLEVDPAGEAAKFTHYVQFVEPIIMPGGISTGPITVVIENPGEGSFDRSTGRFQIPNDEYVIYFEGDLSAFQITSPFRLPSPSEGEVEFNTASSGETRMEWRGETALPSPFQPGAFIPISYTCSVNGSFSLESNATWIMRSTPGQNIIDARQPHPVDDPFAWQGYDYIDLQFNAPVPAELTTEDVMLSKIGGDGIAPIMTDLLLVDDRTVRVVLNEPLEPAAWTNVTVPNFDLSQSGVCVAALPGDVNGDRASNVKDLVTLVNSLRGLTGPLAQHQCDIDRSGACTPADLITLINVLSGAGEFTAFNGVTMPASPCSQ